MSITAMLWSTLYCSAAVLSLGNPLFGALGYLLEYYMRPELKWWGDQLPDLRYNLMISLVLGLTFVLRRSSLRELTRTGNPVLPWLLALMTLMGAVTATVAVDTETSWSWTVQWIKTAIVFPLLVAGVVRSRSGFDLFTVANMVGAAWWGWDAWTNPHRDASRLMEIGSGDTLNDNAASAHLLTVLPFVIVYLLTEKDKRLRALALIVMPLVVNTIILCNSRGSIVGILVAGAASVLLIRRGNRLRLIGVIIGIAATFLMLADSQFIERQQTTSNYEEDGSAQQRLITWQAGYRFVRDRPLGAGGRGFHLLSSQYIPDIVEAHDGDNRAPHNTWVQVAAEWGVLGFICYLGIYGTTLFMLRRIKKRALPAENGFFYWRAFAIQLGLIAYLVAGTFTDRLYGEAGYWLIGLTYALYRIQATDQATVVQPAPAAAIAQTLPLGTQWSLAGGRAR
jgi:hypothetical protein